MFLWLVLLLGLLALLIVWAGSRRRGDHIDRTDRVLVELHNSARDTHDDPEAAELRDEIDDLKARIEDLTEFSPAQNSGQSGPNGCITPSVPAIADLHCTFSRSVLITDTQM